MFNSKWKRTFPPEEAVSSAYFHVVGATERLNRKQSECQSVIRAGAAILTVAAVKTLWVHCSSFRFRWRARQNVDMQTVCGGASLCSQPAATQALLLHFMTLVIVRLSGTDKKKHNTSVWGLFQANNGIELLKSSWYQWNIKIGNSAIRLKTVKCLLHSTF